MFRLRDAMLVNCIVAKAAYIGVGQYLLYVSGGQLGSYLVGDLSQSCKIANCKLQCCCILQFSPNFADVGSEQKTHQLG